MKPVDTGKCTGHSGSNGFTAGRTAIVFLSCTASHTHDILVHAAILLTGINIA
jgi:hypothetical protein